VKFKITREVQKRHAAFHVAEGSVRLFFILRPNGSLERVWTLAEEASTNEVARLFAMECVRQASPFMPFPKSLGKEKICFQATVYF
jgi:small neutral amino acid transporter SnatA (MarC family)